MSAGASTSDMENLCNVRADARPQYLERAMRPPWPRVLPRRIEAVQRARGGWRKDANLGMTGKRTYHS